MKLNDFKQIEKQLNESKLNELDMSDFIGQRAAAGTKVWADKLNPFSKGSGKISVKDKMASEMFVKDFIGRASEDLARAIKGGLVDPEGGSGAAPADPYAKGDQNSPYEPEKKEPTMGAAPTATTPPAEKPQAGAQTRSPNSASQQQPNWHTSQQIGYTPAKTKKPAADVTDVVPKTPKQIGMNNFPRLKESNNFERLDYIFESILEADEPYSQAQPAAQASKYPDTISSYLQKMFKQYTKGITVDPTVISQVKAICDQAQQNYSSMNPMKRGARQELAKLGNMAYALSYRDSAGYQHGKYSAAADQAGAASGQTGQLTGLDALRGRSTASATTDTPATTGAGAATPAASTAGATGATPEQVKSVYSQVKGLMKQLNKQQKGYILKALQKELGSSPDSTPPAEEPAAAAPEPTSNAGSGAFARMGQQLTQPGSGAVHKKSRNNPNIKRRPKTGVAAAAPATSPVDAKAAKIKKARATRKPTNPTIKEFKVWGNK